MQNKVIFFYLHIRLYTVFIVLFYFILIFGANIGLLYIFTNDLQKTPTKMFLMLYLWFISPHLYISMPFCCTE